VVIGVAADHSAEAFNGFLDGELALGFFVLGEGASLASASRTRRSLSLMEVFGQLFFVI
jgi:hypothetical protein